MTDYAAQAARFRGEWGSYRLAVGGKDVTNYRGFPFERQGIDYVDPWGYGNAVFFLPGLTSWDLAEWGTAGYKFIDTKKSVPVVLRHVSPEGVQRVLWRGFTSKPTPTRFGTRLECVGDAAGRLTAGIATPRPFAVYKDGGTVLSDMVQRVGVRLTPNLGLHTGVPLNERDHNGAELLGAAAEVMSLCQQDDGRMLRAMPYGAQGKLYRQEWRPTSGVDYTVFLGAEGVDEDLSSDLFERTTTTWGIGRRTDGGKWGNFVAPNAEGDAAPFPGTLSVGDSGDAVVVLLLRLNGIGALDRDDFGDGFDGEVEDAVKDVQREAGLTVSGVVNEATWNAIFNVAVTGPSLRMAQALPLWQLSAVRRFFRNADGIVTDVNHEFDRSRLDVQRLVDFGIFPKRRARKWAAANHARMANAKIWTGTITLTSDLFAGNYHHGDGEPVVVSRQEPLAGKRIMFRGWDGDTVMHVTADSKSGDDSESVTLTVDSLSRGALEVYQMVERDRKDRDERRHPGRTFIRQHRQVDTSGLSDWLPEIGGKTSRPYTLQGGQWNIVKVIAGDEGTIGRIRLNMDRPVEFLTAVFAKHVSSGYCRRHLGAHPFDTVGKLKNLTVTDGGAGYTTAPAVSFSGGGGSGAAATARVADGKVVGLDWTSRGSGYTSQPDVSLSGGGGSGASARVRLGKTGAGKWTAESVRDLVDRQRILLGAFGDHEQPCGYGEGSKTDDDGGRSDDPLNGRFSDDGSFEYRTFSALGDGRGQRGWLYIAVFPREDCVLPPQRVLWPSYEVGM